MISLAFEKQDIIILIVVIALVIILIASLSVFFLIRNNKNKLLSKVDSLLNNVKNVNKEQIESYLTRLKNISLKNETYVEAYEQINAEYNRMITDDFEKLSLRHKGLKERINEEKKIKKGLMDQIKSFENATNLYKKEIKRIQNDLENYFVEGDKLRVQTTELSNKFQRIKDEMVKNDAYLGICKAELNSYLTDITMNFDFLQDYIAAANYKEANKKIEDIENYLNNINGRIGQIAQYCRLVENVVPQQLAELKEKCENLDEKGYVISKEKVLAFIENTNEVLESCKREFKLLRFGDFEDIYAEIQDKITEVHAHLDNEVVSKDHLDEKYKEVSEKTKEAQNESLKLSRQYKTMLEYYGLDDATKERFQNFAADSIKLGDLSREYQDFLFDNDKHQSSFLLGKVAAMEELADKTLDNINYFTKYFNSIRDYINNTFTTTEELSIKLVKALGKLRFSKCQQVYLKYKDEVNKSLNELKHIKDLLTVKPIALETITNTFSEIVANGENLIVYMENELHNYQLLVKSIIYANPLRYKFNEVDALLTNIEVLLKEGSYKEAQEKVNYLLNNYHPAAYEAFKG